MRGRYFRLNKYYSMLSLILIVFFLFLMQDVAQFGIDWDGPMPENVTDETVEVPSIPCLLTDCDYAELCTNINPLATSSNYGIDIYLDCLEFMHRKLQ
jgi:hypothetical protein